MNGVNVIDNDMVNVFEIHLRILHVNVHVNGRKDIHATRMYNNNIILPCVYL